MFLTKKSSLLLVIVLVIAITTSSYSLSTINIAVRRGSASSSSSKSRGTHNLSPSFAEQEDKDYMTRFSNVARLYGGNEVTQRLKNANVCVIGLGGVGSWVVESLSRSGVGHLTLIDFDDICISNTNRQLPAMTSTVGKFKAEYLRERVLDINPSCNVTVILDFVRPDNVEHILLHNQLTSTSPSDNVNDSHKDRDSSSSGGKCSRRRFDYVVEAADGVSDKAAIIDTCVRSGTPIVVSGGVGGLIDPTLIRISDLNDVVGDNLLMRTRKRLRQKFDYPAGTHAYICSISKKAEVQLALSLPSWSMRAQYTQSSTYSDP